MVLAPTLLFPNDIWRNSFAPITGETKRIRNGERRLRIEHLSFNEPQILIEVLSANGTVFIPHINVNKSSMLLYNFLILFLEIFVLQILY